MRVARPIVVNQDIRRKLEQQARGRSTPARAVMHSRIILLAADGMMNKQIAKTLRVTPRMVTLWHGRFLELGIEGLLKDAPRPGRTPAITPQVTATLIAKTTQSAPTNATQWSTRLPYRKIKITESEDDPCDPPRECEFAEGGICHLPPLLLSKAYRSAFGERS
jgi:ribosomal protein L22